MSFRPFTTVAFCAAMAGAATISSHAQAPARVDQAPRWLDPYREPASRLIGAAMVDNFAWQRLATLTDTIGHRLSGTPELTRAIDWAVADPTRGCT